MEREPAGETCRCEAKPFDRNGRVWIDRAAAGLHGAPNFYADIHYRAREGIPFTTTAREAPYYYRHLDGVLKGISPAGVLLDAGCGDGRFTRKCIKMEKWQVIASDIDLGNLKTLERAITPSQRKRVLLLQANVRHLPLRERSLDAILALGLLNILRSRFVEVCQGLHRLLKPGGILVNSEPTLDGSLLYALVRHDPQEFLDVLGSETKPIDYDSGREKRYAVFEEAMVERLLRQSGFVVEERRGIPVYPSLIFGGLAKEMKVSPAMKKRLAEATDSLGKRSITANRAVIYRSRKP